MTILPFEHNNQPTHDVVDVDPETAMRWLNRNENNRRLSPGKVAQYARDMKAGNWAFNGDPVRFDTHGRLLDGQHRLSAIKTSGTTQRMLVVTNLPSTTQDTMDIGRKRAMGDQLQIAGEKNSNLLAAILRIVVAYHHGQRFFSTAAPTQAEMREYLSRNPQARRATEVAAKSKKFLPAMPSAIGGAYFLSAQKDLEGAELFYDFQLLEGLGLEPGDPALTLRNKFISARSAGQRFTVDEQLRYVMRGWNAFREWRKPNKFQMPKGGWTADNFPEPK